MVSDIINPSNWQLAKLENQLEVAKAYKDSVEKSKPNYWINSPQLVSPLALYKYLKARFGKHNGFISMFKNNTSDNLIHWHYSLSSTSAIIDIIGKNSGIEIFIKTDAGIQLKRKDWNQLIDNVQNDFKNYGKQMADVQSTFEHWRLFVNPFTRVEHTIQEYLAKLIKLNLDEPNTYRLGSNQDFKKYSEQLKSWTRNISDAASLGTTIRMLCPVMGESFVNLILLVFRKEDFKKDDRLYDNLIRQQIDIRVKTLHLNCTCFPEAIDATSNAFKNFHTLMNRRNDFLHGNIDPIKLEVEDVWFDENIIPLFKDDEGFMKKMLKNYCTHVERENALADFDIVSRFIELVLMSMDEASLKVFVQLMSSRMPGINKKTKRLGVLFPEHLAEGYVSF